MVVMLMVVRVGVDAIVLVFSSGCGMVMVLWDGDD